MADPGGATGTRPRPPQWDPILSFLHAFSPKIAEDVPAPAEDVPAPAPAPTLETVEERPHTPGTRKSTRKNFGKPASAYSDSYIQCSSSFSYYKLYHGVREWYEFLETGKILQRSNSQQNPGRNLQ